MNNELAYQGHHLNVPHSCLKAFVPHFLDALSELLDRQNGTLSSELPSYTCLRILAGFHFCLAGLSVALRNGTGPYGRPCTVA